MRRNLIVRGLLPLIALGWILGGCATGDKPSGLAMMLTYPHARTATLTRTPHEHYEYVSSIAAHDARALAYDLDLLFLTDRPTRLTRYHSK
ncbi:MAG: hypothetical protein D6788_09225 [Planctomycetota bacterium]|nr:MAG: hypothetical protein D6788_09225 [Planctomycetota bacterium]